MASLLAVTLSGKAYAETEEPQTLPAEAPTQVVEPAAPAAAEAAPVTAPVSAAAPIVTEAAPAAVQAAPTGDVASAASAPAAAEAPAAVEPAAAEVQTAEIPATVDTSSVAASAAVQTTPAAETLAAQALLPTSVPEVPSVAAEIPADEKNVPEEKSGKSEETVTDRKISDSGESGTAETLLEQEQVPEEDASVPESNLPDTEPLTRRRGAAMTLTAVPSSAGAEDTANRAADAAGTGNDQQNAGQTDGGEENRETGNAATDNPILVRDDGSFVLVNHTGTENLHADGDVSILAAGLNRISSITGTGTVQITGTGILLVDSLEGNLEFQTFTDVYSSDPYQKGSVAVFVKQTDGTYLLVNGTVPGLLDEEYRVEGVTLVMPEETSLLLFGTGAKPAVDENGNVTAVQYYHGPEHGIEADWTEAGNEERDRIVESTGKLTIAQSAELIIRQGAAVLMERLSSLKEQYSSLYPELHTADGGKLTVDGSISGSGIVEFEATAGSVSGTGTVTGHTIIADSPVPISDSGVRFSSPEILLKGSGEIKNLKIHSSTVYPVSSDIIITGLDSTGGTDQNPEIDIEKSVIVLPDSSVLDIKNVTGDLYLRQRKYYQMLGISELVPDEVKGESEYDDRFAQTISGTISGNGTVVFGSGIFIITEGTKAEGVTFSTKGGGLVYNYAADIMDGSVSPLHIRPSDAVPAGENGGKIAVAAAIIEEFNNVLTAETLDVYQNLGSGVKNITILENVTLKDSADQPLSVLNAVADGSNWTLSLDSLKTVVQQNLPNKTDAYGTPYPCGVVVELLYKSGGSLSTVFLSGDSLTGTVDTDGLCLIRVSYVYNEETISPGGTATQTGTLYTGSGILGGAGAGSTTITIGGQTYDLSSASAVDLHPTGDSSSNPTPDPDPVPLVATVEETPNAPLIWAEVSPAASTDAASPAEAQYVVLALEGEKTLEELGGKATISMNYTLPAEYAGKPLYVVFRNEDGTLTAIRATYSNITGLLRFITDRLGTFMVVGFDFDGLEFSEEFYAALAQLDVLKNLAFAEYSPV